MLSLSLSLSLWLPSFLSLPLPFPPFLSFPLPLLSISPLSPLTALEGGTIRDRFFKRLLMTNSLTRTA